jgi:hypothetical protein
MVFHVAPVSVSATSVLSNPQHGVAHICAPMKGRKMRMHPTKTRNITRRAAVAGAPLGGVAMAVDPAAAQRCPAAGPREKGPRLWLNMDQEELDDAYDNSVYAFNAKTIGERREFNNDIARGLVVPGT